MSYNHFLMCVVVTLFYSTTLINTVNGNCPKDCPLPRSCKDWYNLGIRKNCYYPIYPDGNTQHLVYCDMKGTHCDGKGGWTRVAYLNMTDSGATCPPGLSLQLYNNIEHGLCGRPSSSSSAGCNSTNFSTLGLNYYKVCGQVRGYQYQATDAFYQLSKGIDSYYVDGISITYGKNPRSHIWTYAGGIREDRVNSLACPCNTGYSGGRNVASSFVGNHYYCESALDPSKNFERILYANDTLWDGKNCDSSEASCCTNFKMPWFYRLLHDMTQGDIELRVCGNAGVSRGKTPLDIIELYVC